MPLPCTAIKSKTAQRRPSARADGGIFPSLGGSGSVGKQVWPHLVFLVPFSRKGAQKSGAICPRSHSKSNGNSPQVRVWLCGPSPVNMCESRLGETALPVSLCSHQQAAAMLSTPCCQPGPEGRDPPQGSVFSGAGVGGSNSFCHTWC